MVSYHRRVARILYSSTLRHYERAAGDVVPRRGPQLTSACADLRLGSGILFRLLLFLFHLSDSLHLVVCRTAKCNATLAGAIVLCTPLDAPLRRPNAT